MPRGYPDYGIIEALGKSLLPLDAADLATQLGSFTAYDKRGDVVILDGFEDVTLKWRTVTVGGASFVILDSTHVKNGAQACQLHADVVAADYAEIRRGIGLLPTSGLGIEVSWRHNALACDLRVGFGYYDGARVLFAYLNIDFGLFQFAIYNAAGGLTLIHTAASIVRNAMDFHTVKLVVDFGNRMYKRLMYDGTEFDLSAHAVNVGLPTIDQFIIPIITLTNTGGAGDIWLDDFILTQDEP